MLFFHFKKDNLKSIGKGLSIWMDFFLKREIKFLFHLADWLNYDLGCCRSLIKMQIPVQQVQRAQICVVLASCWHRQGDTVMPALCLTWHWSTGTECVINTYRDAAGNWPWRNKSSNECSRDVYTKPHLVHSRPISAPAVSAWRPLPPGWCRSGAARTGAPAQSPVRRWGQQTAGTWLGLLFFHFLFWKPLPTH